MRILLYVLVLLFCSCQQGDLTSQSLFYSGDSERVRLKFNDYFLVPTDNLEQAYQSELGLEDLSENDQEVIKRAAKLQVQHLYGVFTYHQKPTDFSINSGAILEKSLPNIRKISVAGGFVRVDYSYEDGAIFYKGLIKGKRTKIKFLMPNAPTEIYQKSIPKDPKIDPITKEPINPCSDIHDNSDLAFWYYWSPDRKGCPASFKKHLHDVKATLVRGTKTKSTYPEYRKLYFDSNETDDNRTINIDIIVGQDVKFNDPSDSGRRSFLHDASLFEGMMSSEGKPTFSVIRSSVNYRRLKYKTDLFEAYLNIYYVDTENSRFDEVAARGLRRSDILIYAGHSYEGYYFDLERLFAAGEETLPKDKYQIMFFNGCTTYSYYNNNYFDQKKSEQDVRGTKNLDLITNGIGAPFLLDGADAAPMTAEVILATSLLGVDATGNPLNELLSWQDILDEIADNAGYHFTALTNIQGDTDNPKRLAKDIPVPLPL